MMTSCLVLRGLLLFGLASSAEGEVRLEWKFNVGDTFYIENITKMKQVVEGGGKKVVHEMTTTAGSRYRLLSKSADGIILEMTPQSNVTVTPDSKTPKPTPFSDKLSACTFQVTLDANGQVVKFEGFEQF